MKEKQKTEQFHLGVTTSDGRYHKVILEITHSEKMIFGFEQVLAYISNKEYILLTPTAYFAIYTDKIISIEYL